jgi:uncharacterized protein YciI
MFIVEIIYKKSLEYIDQHLAEHRAFLDHGYRDNYFVASGPKNPRTGGIIISQLTHREQLENILKQDPFNIHGLAEYHITEFNPVKYHPDFASFVDVSL